MTTHAVYLNLIKYLTMAFVLGSTAYMAAANDVIIDLDPFPACVECRPEPGFAETDPSQDLPEISREASGMISMTVLNPDLTDFDSVRFAIVEVADLEIAAEYLSYSLIDINHDNRTDMVFYFSRRDLMPSHSTSPEDTHDACLFVNILKTDKTTGNYSLCEQAVF